MHADFGLPFPGFHLTEYPHYYRRHTDGESEEQFATRMADALEALIIAEGPDTVGAFIAEPVMGAGGGIVPPRTYWEKMQAVVRKYDMLFIADEVICGFGRTGNMWGSITYDLKPDMISCAKALSAAMQPISAVMVNERVFAAMLDESKKLGNFAHGFTYAGHPVDHGGRAGNVAHLRGNGHGAARPARRCLYAAGARQVHRPPTRRRRARRRADGRTRDDGRQGDAYAFDPSRKVGAIADKHARAQGMIMRSIGDRIAFSPPLIITRIRGR